MFRLYFGDHEMNAFPTRPHALQTARKLSADHAREVIVEGPQTRYIYEEGHLDRFWYELKRR